MYSRIRKYANCLIVVFIAILITSCASQQPPKVVKIPIAVPCPTPILPKQPLLPIAKLKSDSPPNVVIKAYAQSVEILQAYATELRTILNSYNH